MMPSDVSSQLMPLTGAKLAVQVTVGHSKGETVLPLPAEAQLGTGVSDKDHVRFLEAALVTWSQQIKEVLKADPSAGLLVRSISELSYAGVG